MIVNNPDDLTGARLKAIRGNRNKPREDYLTDRGRLIHGPTAPGQSTPVERDSDLSEAEVKEVRTLIADGRKNRRAVTLPERLKSRSWKSVEEVLLGLEYELGWEGGGWKVGAASLEVRAAENIPSPSPGRLFKKSIFNSPAIVTSDHFVNYRLCEFEFAFQLNLDFPVRNKEYTEADLKKGIDSLLPAIEIGDSVFEDWYSVSGYYGGMYDNGGGAAFITGRKEKNWQEIELPQSNIDVYINDNYIKSGQGYQAMGNPVTSLTWMINWARERGRPVNAGEYVSTGTCTAHTFLQPGDTASGDFGPLGLVEARFV